MKPPLCPHDWAQGLHGRPVLLTQHSPPLLPPEAGTQHMRDLSSAVLRKLVELSPGLDDVDMVPPEPPTMSDELFLTLHLLYSGLCTSVDVYGLPAAGDGAATYFGTRPPAGYGVRPRAARAARVPRPLAAACCGGQRRRRQAARPPSAWVQGRLEHALARLLESNGTMCLHDGLGARKAAGR